MQRGDPVRGVDGLAALAGLRVQGAAGRHEPGHVGDRVVDPVTLAFADQMHRLIQIHRSRRIDGDERQPGQIRVRKPVLGDRSFEFRAHLRAEAGRQLEFGLQSRQGFVQGPVIVGHDDLRMRHKPSLMPWSDSPAEVI